MVKTHPLEKAIDEYRKSLIPVGVEVVGNEANLLEILSRARIQISIYSTTFYDALGLGVCNMSLQEFTTSADYAREMVSGGLALALGRFEDPIEKFENQGIGSVQLTRAEVYAPFDPTVIGPVLS
jgi:hypothetical protein